MKNQRENLSGSKLNLIEVFNMRSFILLGFLFIALISKSIFAQNVTQQWEYLEINEYSSVNLNELGKKGWELVGFNQFEGSSVKFIFKRPFVAERTKKETEQNAKSELQKVQPEFVDLDSIEAKSDQKEKERKANEKIEQAIRKIKEYTIVSIKTNSWFPSQNDRRVVADVVIDATKELLKDGNKYRSSEVKSFIRQAALEIFKAAELKPKYPNQEPFQEYFSVNNKGVNIKLAVIVNYNGETKTLVEGSVIGDWLETQYP